MTDIIKAALVVAKKFPVFPTINKKPCWSNSALGVKKGEGGYRIATQNPDEIQKLFDHTRATEIAVPMGEMSGLLCIDVDVYKYPDLEKWVDDNSWLAGTLCHKTRSGGYHFFFKHPGNDIKFPATLREGVDIKAAGNGYVCFPPTEGYRPMNRKTAKKFPLGVLVDAMKAKGGTGKLNGSGDSESDGALITRIVDASDLYPALRALSYRLPEMNESLSEQEQIDALEAVMQDSVAADEGHARHEDWLDRYSKIGDLVESANRKHNEPLMSDEALAIGAAIADKSIIDLGRMIADGARHVGPQRAPTADKIGQLVAEENLLPDQQLITVSAQSLKKTFIEGIDWIIPGVLPAGNIFSLAGASSVGKTRWLAGWVMSLAVGDTERMGLPSCGRPRSTLWLANEERQMDIVRRLKACQRQHADKTSADISIRGKDEGQLRLVNVNELGQPEIDQDVVARIVKWIIETKSEVTVMDPYVTLSVGGDENSSTTASMITDAFILIIETVWKLAEFRCSIANAHHTPKGARSDDDDWYKGDQAAWRGSGAIHSGLDTGFTLSPYMPPGKDARKSWKAAKLEHRLARWVRLDSCKVREGETVHPIVYELVGQEMDKGEGEPIGVCRLASADEADSVLIDAGIDAGRGAIVARSLRAVMGPGKHDSKTQIEQRMAAAYDSDSLEWPYPKQLRPDHLASLVKLLQDGVGGVTFKQLRQGENPKYRLEIE